MAKRGGYGGMGMMPGNMNKSCQTLVTPWTVACQSPLSMGFPRQEYWNELPFPSPGNPSNPGIKPVSLVCPALQVDSLPSQSSGKWCSIPNKCLKILCF